MNESKHIAIVGAGMAAIACARTLVEAGHQVSVFEKSHGLGGRMSTRNSPFGTFDHGAQYFTVRDPRFALALQTAPGVCRPWSVTMVQVLDHLGRVAAAGLPAREPHLVPAPGMRSLAAHWAEPLAASVHLQTCVTHIEADSLHKGRWQLRTLGPQDSAGVHAGFDAVLLAIPHPQANTLLQTLPAKVAGRAALLLSLIHI